MSREYCSTGRSFQLVDDGIQIKWHGQLNRTVHLKQEQMRDVGLALQAAYAQGQRDIQDSIKKLLDIKITY